jgi:hypothetical protein
LRLETFLKRSRDDAAQELRTLATAARCDALQLRRSRIVELIMIRFM